MDQQQRGRGKKLFVTTMEKTSRKLDIKCRINKTKALNDNSRGPWTSQPFNIQDLPQHGRQRKHFILVSKFNQWKFLKQLDEDGLLKY